jgi:hypothetical protein
VSQKDISISVSAININKNCVHIHTFFGKRMAMLYIKEKKKMMMIKNWLEPKEWIFCSENIIMLKLI